MRVGGTGGKGARLHEAPGLGAAILMVIPEGEAVVVTGATQSGDVAATVNGCSTG